MDSASQTAIIANAARLLKDAKLPVDHERYASAFALSVLALEEIGKVVLDLWDKPEAPPKLINKRPSAHVRKQAAVSSLLLAEAVTKELGEVIVSGCVGRSANPAISPSAATLGRRRPLLRPPA